MHRLVPQMSSLADLWSALRKAGVESVAPLLVRNGTVSVNQVALHSEALLLAGVRQWQIEAILAASEIDQVGRAPIGEPSTRPDVPGSVLGKRANLQAALDAAAPNQRQRSLQQLDADVLSRTTCPANEARVRTYMAICRAWDTPAWPLTAHNVRCFGASLKAGQYRSAQVYYQAITGYQQRTLREEVPVMVRHCIKDCIRSIQRGLGVSALKDSFDGMAIGRIEVSDDAQAFSFDKISHCKDVVIIGLWYMLREVEMANARAVDVQLIGSDVSMTVPLHKTDPHGKFTQRTLSCSCGAKIHALCIWHSCERHLLRLEEHPCRTTSHRFPLFPEADGTVAAKARFIDAFRRVISAAGIPTTRLGPQGLPMQRFHGHCLRVSGAQMLTSAGVDLALVQLLGRWTSSSVWRYVQDSGLNQLPRVAGQVLNQEDEGGHVRLRVAAVDAAPMTPTLAAAAPATPKAHTAKPKAMAAQDRGLRAELELLKEAVVKPGQTFVFRPKAKIIHKASRFEDSNNPDAWRTDCGWNYGLSNFLRTCSIQEGTRKCRKCFDVQGSSSSGSSEESAGSGVSESSASSEED